MADHDRRPPEPGGPPDPEIVQNLQEAFEGTDSEPPPPPEAQDKKVVTPAQDPVEALAHELDGPGDGLADEVAALRAERDEYLDHVRRLQADFDNYRKRMLRDQTSYLERAT